MRGEFGEQREMRRRRLIRRRNAHETGDLEAVLASAVPDESRCFFRQDARLLRLGPGIDLDEEARAPALPDDLGGERPGDLRPVDGLDDVEQGDRVGGLVRLQGTEEMEFDVRELGLERRPFRGRLLDAVFSEDAMAGEERLADPLGRHGFRDGDDLDRRGSACFLQGGGDPRADRSDLRLEIGWRMSVGHEGLRGRAATLAAAAAALKQASLESGGATAPFSLAFLTDRRRIPNPEPVLRALPRGAAVIYRDYDDPRRASTAARYTAICARRGVLFLVAGDEGLAREIGADGAHWPARMMPATRVGFPPPLAGEASAAPREGGPSARFADGSPARGGAKRPFLLTAACHDAAELARAAAIGADLALLSPVFPTESHPGAEHLGPARFRALAAAASLPVLALGGVDETNAAALAGPNVAGLAAIGAFFP